MAYGLTQSADLEAGSSQYFSRADTASLSITGNYTVEAWIKLESTPSGGGVYPICMKNDAGSNRSTNFVLQESGGNVLLSFGVDETGNNSDTSSVDYIWNPSTGVWYHVAGVFTAATGAVELFVDGSSVASNTGTATAIYDGGASTYIGFQGGTSRYFDGRISLVRVWSTNRSGAQLTADKCNVLGATANLAAEWTLDNTVNDNSGNANTLTNNNSVTFGADVPAVCAVAGPTTVKTWDGVTQSTGIKTYFGVDLANVKSVDGAT